MKNLINFTLFALLLLSIFLSSCSSDKDYLYDNDQINSSLVLRSSITTKKLDNIHEDIVAQYYFNSDNTRGEEAFKDETNCKRIIKPLINDGEDIKQQILTDNSLILTEEERIFFESLEEEDLAILSIMILDAAYDDQCTDITLDEQFDTRGNLDGSKVRSCLAFALGVSAIQELALKKVITAATLRSTLLAIGKRYLGYIGVTLMVFDFYDCFYK